MADNLYMFVGRQHYPYVEDYIDEAYRMGCCKKVNKIPKDISIGESVVFLLYKDEVDVRIFGWFTIDGLIKCSLQQQLIDEVKEFDGQELVIPALRREHRAQIPQRGCGGIDPPSYYLVSPNDITSQLGFRKSPNGEDTMPIHVVDCGIAVECDHFRGFKYTDAQSAEELAINLNLSLADAYVWAVKSAE